MILHHAKNRKDNRLALRLMNKFRNEYFEGNPPFEMTWDFYKDLMRSGGVEPWLYMNGKNVIAYLDLAPGITRGVPSISIATIYIVPRYRKNNISNSIYNAVEQLAKSYGGLFNIQVEERFFLNNEQKYRDLGFMYYEVNGETNSIGEYKDKTYLLFKQQVDKDSISIKKG